MFCPPICDIRSPAVSDLQDSLGHLYKLSQTNCLSQGLPHPMYMLYFAVTEKDYFVGFFFGILSNDYSPLENNYIFFDIFCIFFLTRTLRVRIMLLKDGQQTTQGERL